MATWTAVTLTAPAELEEALASFLIDQGAPGLETSERHGSVRLVAHFPSPAKLDALQRFCDTIAEIFPGASRPRIECSDVDDRDWAENWKEHFSPLEIGARLFVHPPWVRSVPAGRIGIEIDPGMAFGTGHHASTRGCLHLLERAFEERPRGRVLDIGTGSGILAIAAAKLGAAEVWAVDIDPDACRIAADNFRINGVQSTVRVAPSLDEAHGDFDVILANLFAAQLIELAPWIARRLHPPGLAIGSGLLASEAAAVRRAWSAAGLEAHGEHAEEGWVTVGSIRKAAASSRWPDAGRDS